MATTKPDDTKKPTLSQAERLAAAEHASQQLFDADVSTGETRDGHADTTPVPAAR